MTNQKTSTMTPDPGQYPPDVFLSQNDFQISKYLSNPFDVHSCFTPWPTRGKKAAAEAVLC